MLETSGREDLPQVRTDRISSTHSSLMQQISRGMLVLTNSENSNNSEENAVNVTLLTENGGETFSAPRASLIKQSQFFEKLLSQTTTEDSQIECEICCYPDVFDQFIRWVNHPRQPIKYKPSSCSEDFWIECAASAWFLALDLGAIQFERYALSQFIQNCSLSLFGPWKSIESSTSKGASLRKFSDYWVAWNFYLSGGGNSEYSGLLATKMVSSIADPTKDPRKYSLEHWYSVCGGSLQSCLVHDPGLQGLNIVFGERRIRQPVDEWGAEFERRL
jgi:hypothetical protein